MALLPAADVQAAPEAAGAHGDTKSEGLPLHWQAVFDPREIYEVGGAVRSFNV